MSRHKPALQFHFEHGTIVESRSFAKALIALDQSKGIISMEMRGGVWVAYFGRGVSVAVDGMQHNAPFIAYFHKYMDRRDPRMVQCTTLEESPSFASAY